MKTYYWTPESWGEDTPPENADELIEQANDLIDEYAETRCVDPDILSAYSEGLWEFFSSYGMLPPAYVFHREKAGDGWSDLYRTEAEALRAADNEWHHLTRRERKRHTDFYVGLIAPDAITYGWNGDVKTIIKDYLRDSDD